MSSRSHGMGDVGSITDVEEIRVGQVSRSGGGWLTGVTVVLPPPGTVVGVDVRGGGPGTHETDALDPRTLVPTADAVVLTGGSAFGLVAAHGTQRWLAENGRGFQVGAKADEVVPIVPAAAIFDLGRGGSFSAHPDQEMGYEAARLAGDSPPGAPVERGNAGAGTGAVLGGRFKGGVGTASIRLLGANGGIVVGGIVVVNAVGLPWPRPEELLPGDAEPSSLNTTVAVVATNARLDSAEVSRVATVAHDGFARALNPVHTLADGDTIFALATCGAEIAGSDRRERIAGLVELHTAAAETIRLATLDGIRSAKRVTTPVADLMPYPHTENFDGTVVR